MRRQLEHSETNFTFEREGGVVILDKLRTPENIGMIIRLCVAFEMEKVIIISDIHSPPQHRTENISRLGTREIKMDYSEDVVGNIIGLKEKGYCIIGIETTTDSINISEYARSDHQKYALIFGNERVGISPEALQMCDVCLHIPISKKMTSLNVAMSAAIAIQNFRS